MWQDVYVSTTPTKSRNNQRRISGGATANQRNSGGARKVQPRVVRHWSGQRLLLTGAVVTGLTLWLGSWVVAAAALVYGAHLRSTGWTWARIALHLVGAAFAAGLVVFVATTFGPGPGLLAGVVTILIWRWDHNRPMAVRMDAVVVPAVDRETQLEAAFAEGFNRGQREARKVRQAMERSVPAFDPNDPDSF